jgi:hypothetical protein
MKMWASKAQLPELVSGAQSSAIQSVSEVDRRSPARLFLGFMAAAQTSRDESAFHLRCRLVARPADELRRTIGVGRHTQCWTIGGFADRRPEDALCRMLKFAFNSRWRGDGWSTGWNVQYWISRARVSQYVTREDSL